MSKYIGQPIVLEYKPGANSVIGWEYVAKQVPADGYTITLGFVTSLASLPLIVKDLRFDPLKDLPAVTVVAEGRIVLASSSQQPWKSFNEFAAQAKASPGKLTFGAADPAVRLSSEAFFRSLGLNLLYVPYSGAAQLFTELAGGHLHMSLISIATVNNMGDKLRALAVTGNERVPAFADAPTFAELGVGQIPGLIYSLNVPAGIPKNAFERIQGAASQALQQPDVKARFAKLHLEVVNTGPEPAARLLADQARLFADVVTKTGIKLN
jgi:tripartite-type tricarboxylate transporter receptor subunit TctC